MVSKGKTSDIRHLDFCKAFGMVPYSILGFRLERHEFKGWNIWGIRNWLDGYSQKVVINGFMFRWRLVTSRFPQGSVLGLVHANLYQWHSEIECSLSR